MGFLCLRIYSIENSNFSGNSAAQNNSRSIVLTEQRGSFYDCNGQPLTGDNSATFAAAKPTSQALDALKLCVSKEVWDGIQAQMQRGYPAVVPVTQTAVNCDDIKLLQVPQRYADTQLAAHLIGYLNAEGEGVSGLEKSYDALLQNSGAGLSVYFPVDANGQVLSGSEPEVRSSGSSPLGGVQLTINKQIQQIAEDSLDQVGIQAGCAIVLENDTGAIRAMVSRPTFNPNNLAPSLHQENAPLIQRSLTGIPIGSVFKPVIAAAALEQGISPDLTYTCTGSIQVGNHTFYCHNRNGHGSVNMTKAIADSCNPYFIHLTQQLSIPELLDTVKKCGYATEYNLAEGLQSAEGHVPSAADLQAPAALANFSFGQGALLGTPLQVAVSIATISSGGKYRLPYLVEGFINRQGDLYDAVNPAAPEQVLQESTAISLQNFMQETVRNGSGVRAQPDSCSAGGKTATAETGSLDGDRAMDTVWFAGFFPADQPKYTVVVMAEDGVSGGSDCAPVFKQIADQIWKLQTINDGN